MTNVAKIEKAVAELPSKELAKSRARFERFEAERYDRRIAQDVFVGRLAEESLAEFRSGRAREL